MLLVQMSCYRKHLQTESSKLATMLSYTDCQWIDQLHIRTCTYIIAATVNLYTACRSPNATRYGAVIRKYADMSTISYMNPKYLLHK